MKAVSVGRPRGEQSTVCASCSCYYSSSVYLSAVKVNKPPVPAVSECWEGGREGAVRAGESATTVRTVIMQSTAQHTISLPRTHSS